MWFWRKGGDNDSASAVRDWLSEEEWQAAIAQVQKRPLDFNGRERRDDQRIETITRCLLRVERRGGVLGMLLVRTRNLSSTGMCVVHGGRVPRHCKATIVIQTEDGRGIITTGKTRWCKRIAGDTLAHEIGVEFDAPIDVSAFVPGEARDASAA